MTKQIDLRKRLKEIGFIRRLYYRYKSILMILSDVVLEIAVKNNSICKLIMFFDRQNVLEYRILLYGNKVYRSNLKKRQNEYYLKRQLHRIEKGLIRADRKEVFGLGYILPAVEVLANMAKFEGKRNTFLIYAYEVFAKYFAVTESDDSTYNAAKNLFKSLNYSPTNKYLPYRYVRQKPDFSVFENLVFSRKSIRQFSTEDVGKEIFENAVKLASQAPSGCNRQPYRFLVIKKKEFVDKFSSFPPGGGGNSFGAPALVFVIGDQSSFPETNSSHEVYIDASLTSMIFVLALESMGVSSCFMNWPHIYELNKKAFKELGLKPYEVIVTSIAVGYADENATCAFSLRKDVEEILEYYGE